MKKIIALFAFASLLWSCDNDLEIYSDNSNLTYVYGLLNPTESYHYVRVVKTSQKETADLTFDDLYYTDDEITVYLDEFDGSTLINTVEATPIVADDKNEGLFPFPTQKYYKIHHPDLYSIFQNENTYSIRVEKHFGDNEIITNESNFKLEPNLSFVSIDNEVNFWVGTGNTIKPFPVSWKRKSGQSGRETADLNFYYTEENLTTNEIDTQHFSINMYNDIPESGTSTMNTKISFNELIPKMRKALGTGDDNIRRRMINIVKDDDNKIVGRCAQVDIWASSSELTLYESYLFSNDGITQDKPNYTNLDNAIGLFSSRINIKRGLDNNSYYLNHRTLDSLACSSELRKYNFAKLIANPDGTIGEDFSPTRCN